MNYGRIGHLLQLRGPAVMLAPPKDGEGGDDEGGDDDGAGEEGGDGEDAEGGDDGTGDDGSEGGEDGGDEGDGEEGGDPPAAAAGGDDGDPEPKKRVPWQVKKIGKLTAEKTAAERRADAAEARAAAAEALVGKPNKKDGEEEDPPARRDASGERLYTKAELDAEVEERAARNARNAKFNTVFDAASAADPKFEARAIAMGAAFKDQMTARPDFFSVIGKLDNGAAVLNTLTQDLDFVGELLEMEPADLALELAKMDGKVKKEPGKQISKNGADHKPPKPLGADGGGGGGGRDGGGKDYSKMSMSDFAKQRAKDREEREKANRW